MILEHAVPGPSRDDLVLGAGGAAVPVAAYVPERLRPEGIGVLVALHGAGSNGWTFLEQVRPLADACGVAIVCPTAPPQRDGERNLDLSGLFGRRFRGPRWTYGAGDAAWTAVRESAGALGIAPGRTALLGTSMGGIAVWNLALRHPDQLAAAFVVNAAPSMWELFGPDATVDALLANLLPLPLTVVHGRQDAQIPLRLAEDAVRRLRALGHPDVELVEVGAGEHAWDTMGLAPGSGQFDELVARIVAAPAGSSWPRRVEHRAVADEHGRAHWVSLSGIEPGAPATVSAAVTGPRSLRVDVRAAARLRLHLSTELVEPGPVDVVLNGRHHATTFRPDAALLGSHAHGGPPPTSQVVDLELDLPPDRREDLP